MDTFADFSVGDAISQFIVTAEGAMAVIDGVVTSVSKDRITYSSESEEHIVTLDLIDTII